MRARLPTARDRSGGFTLLEVALAMAVLGLVAALALPRITQAPGPTRLRAASQEIAGLLRHDRNAAIRGRVPVTTSLDLAGRTLRSGAGGGTVAIPPGVAVDFTRAASQTDAGGGGIRFSADGRASGGVITLRRTDGLAYDVAVNWLTGGVTVAERGGQ